MRCAVRSAPCAGRRSSKPANAQVVVLLLLLGSVTGCVTADADPPTDVPSVGPALTAIVVDRSTSRKPAEIAQDRQLVDSIIERLDFGDRILIQQVHQSGRGDGAPRWWTDMPRPSRPGEPTPVDGQSLKRARKAAALAVDEVFENGRPNRTDLMSNLFDVGDLMASGKFQRSRVIMLSDMLQSTDEVNMEGRAGIPAVEWIAERKQRRLLPNLTGACVVVIGADRSTSRGEAVFTFWQEYFRAAGTDLVPSNYLYVVFNGKDLRC